MKYLAIIYDHAGKWDSVPAEEMQRVIAIHDAWNTKYGASGELLTAFGLGDETSAQVVKVRGGVPVVTDGPYLEAKEYIGSAYVLNVESVERAHELLAELPSAAQDGIELWPILHGDPGGPNDATKG